MRPDELRRMVMEVNKSVLDKEEFLSDNVYRYARKTGRMTIAWKTVFHDDSRRVRGIVER